MNEKYVAQDIEKKWQAYWLEHNTFKTDYDESKENIMYSKCSHIHRGIYIWGMCVTTPLVT